MGVLPALAARPAPEVPALTPPVASSDAGGGGFTGLVFGAGCTIVRLISESALEIIFFIALFSASEITA